MLDVVNLKKSFNNRLVLKNVNFTIKSGEIVMLLGKNGSGKTTIINCLLKLVKPDYGTIYLDDEEISEIGNKIYFNRISALLESSENVYDSLTGYENIDYFSGLYGINLKNSVLFNKYLQLFELQDSINNRVGTYSRGMKQKLALIISLLSDPEIILLDEPTLGLDIFSKDKIIEIIKKLAEEENKSFLITSHQLDVIEKLEGKVLLLNDGRINELIFYNKNDDQDYYKITYFEKGIIKTVREKMDIEEVASHYKNKNIIEIAKVGQDLEQLIKENLNEFD